MKALKLTGIVAGTILLMLLILIAAAPKVAQYIAFKGLSPAERKKMQAQYEEWRGKKLAIPAAALDVKPYSAETQTVAKAFDAAWTTHCAEAIKLKELYEKSKGAPSAAELKAVAPNLVRMMPLLDAFAAVVRQPEYTISDFGAARLHEAGGIPIPNYPGIGACARLLYLRALAAIQDGKPDHALADMELLLRSAKAGTYDSILAQGLGQSFSRLAIASQRDLLRQGGTSATLRRMSEIQDRLAPNLRFFPDRTTPLAIIDRLSGLRELKRRGMAVDVRNVTSRELLGETMEAQALYLQTKVLPAVTKDWVLAEKVRNNITAYRQGAGQVGGAAYRQAGFMTRLFSNISAPATFRAVTPNFDGFFMHADETRADFETLRRETARKLEELERGRPGAPRPAPTPPAANINSKTSTTATHTKS